MEKDGIYNSEKLCALIVDNEVSVREDLSEILKEEDFDVFMAESGTEALKMVKEEQFRLIFLDLQMKGLDVFKFINLAPKYFNKTRFIVMTDYGTIESAIDSIRQGVYDYILKPIKVDDIRHQVRRVLKRLKLEEENLQLKAALSFYRVSQAMDLNLNLDEVLDVILEVVKKEMDAQAVGIILLNSDKNPEKIYHYPRQDEKILSVFKSFDYQTIRDEIKNKAFCLSGGKQIIGLSDHEKPIPSCSLVVPLKVKNMEIGFFNVLSFDPIKKFSPGQAKILTIFSTRAAVAIENVRLYLEMNDTLWQAVEGFTNALEAKDLYTHGHSHKVKEYAMMICNGLRLDEEETEEICHAALLHDIGKIGIKLEFLNKSEHLDEKEYEIFKKHSLIGRKILEPIGLFKNLVPIVYYHHERYNGSGYPEGIKGDKIPIGARILAVADAYDAMTSNRAYREGLPHLTSIDELRRYSGLQFDPEIVEVFIEQFEEMERLKKEQEELY